MFVRYKGPYNLEKAHIHDSGYDIRAREEIKINPLDTKVIPTGVYLELPTYMEVQVRPKSSLSSQGLLVHFGTIDAGYRGEVKVAMSNLSGVPAIFKKGQKVAQLVFAARHEVSLAKVNEIACDTDRGEGGFGSTGKF